MDTILVLGLADDKLLGFMEKVGYNILHAERDKIIETVQANEIIDLIILDARKDEYGVELLEFFHAEQNSRDVPVLFISDKIYHQDAIRELGLKTVEFVKVPYSIGSLVSKIATNLRLRKMAGKDEETASLGEINAQLRDLIDCFQKELKEAREIQESLIPASLPDDARFEMAVSYVPLEEVGGDWYYVKEEEDDRISVQIADVTGHGLSAAFIGSMTKLAMAAANTVVPQNLLTRMNALMAPNIPAGKFVTIFSYLYDPATGEFEYARGGHTPGLVLNREKGEVKQVLGDGFALGFFEESEYQANKAKLGVNDFLIVFTDGIPEAANRSNEVYGYAPMEKLMKESKPSATAGGILETILVDFEEFIDGRILKDDVTIIALKRLK